MIEGIELSYPMIRILIGALGVVVLVAGRKLFWLTIGAVGFISGILFVLLFLQIESIWIMLVIALVAGAIGVVLALVLQKLAVGIAGFLMGAYALTWLTQNFIPDLTYLDWLWFLVGGVIGGLLVTALFDSALVGLSAFVGATMIMLAAPLNQTFSLVLFVVLLVIGIGIQSRRLSVEN